MLSINGQSFIGAARMRATRGALHALEARMGKPLEPLFCGAALPNNNPPGLARRVGGVGQQ